jgi:hypothetical protein
VQMFEGSRLRVLVPVIVAFDLPLGRRSRWRGVRQMVAEPN